MFDIITIGSATIDIFVDTKEKLFKKEIPFGRKILIDQLKTHLGGSALNTAVGFSRLGLKTACLTKIGQGGQKIINLLKKEGVETRLIIQDKNLLTDYSIILAATGQDRTILVHKDASKKLRISDIKLRKLKTKWLYLGSMLDESLETTKKIADWAQTKNIKIALNTSSYLAQQKPKALLRAADVLIVNQEEAELLTNNHDEQSKASPGPTSVDEIFRALSALRMTEGIIVITNKDKKVIAFDGKEKYVIMPHSKVEVKERTGAGDAFACGFITGLIKKDDLNFALKLGRANAESVIGHYGAQNKLLNWQEAQKLLKNF